MEHLTLHQLGSMLERGAVSVSVEHRRQQRDRFVARLFADNLGRFLDGKPLKEVVDRKAGY